jgi:broad specificity phosphatase PhoE
MSVTELWLVRHGESMGNVAASRAQREGLDVIPLDIRDADVPLSPVGARQARALGEWLSAHRGRIDEFWVSPYVRARETLAIALAEDEAPVPAAVRTVPVTIDERLRDRELGILDLLTRAGVERLHPGEAERRRHLGKFYHRPPGGESWADVALRLRSFLRDALADPGPDPGAGPDRRVLVVVHDAVVMLLLYVLLPLSEEQLLEFAADHTVDNASITHLRLTETGWELVDFSNVEHLVREGAPVTEHAGSPDVEPE